VQGNIHDARIQCWVNGSLRQDSRTSNMIFNVAEIIHQLSQGMTLYPGDVILTGTPAGVGYAMDPPEVLKSGDHIRMEIEELGVLENTIA
jgi:2-keto-4-pentenoate hydratase/2-oxohepta-3-ene-1,7-dioic acid hydratase in catechol pathway